MKNRAKAGQLIRFLDVPAEGIIRDLANPKAFVDQLKTACGQHFGTAGPAFVSAITENSENAAELRETLTDLIKGVSNRLTPKGAPPEVARATDRFALAEAAGLLAVELGILPFTVDEVSAAVTEVYTAWLQEARSVPDVVRSIESIRDFILKHREGRFRKLEASDSSYQMRDLAGYWDEERGLYLLTPEGFKEACGGHDPKQVAAELSKRGLLFKNDSRPQSKHVVTKGSKQLRFYAVNEEILELRLDIPGIPESAQAVG
jgi:uncharacterized protein (DUF927 family)